MMMTISAKKARPSSRMRTRSKPPRRRARPGLGGVADFAHSCGLQHSNCRATAAGSGGGQRTFHGEAATPCAGSSSAGAPGARSVSTMARAVRSSVMRPSSRPLARTARIASTLIAPPAIGDDARGRAAFERLGDDAPVSSVSTGRPRTVEEVPEHLADAAGARDRRHLGRLDHAGGHELGLGDRGADADEDQVAGPGERRRPRRRPSGRGAPRGPRRVLAMNGTGMTSASAPVRSARRLTISCGLAPDAAGQPAHQRRRRGDAAPGSAAGSRRQASSVRPWLTPISIGLARGRSRPARNFDAGEAQRLERQLVLVQVGDDLAEVEARRRRRAGARGPPRPRRP